MENNLLTVVIALALLLLSFCAGKLFRLVLPAESVMEHRKSIRLISILLFAVGVMCVGYAMLPSAVSFSVRLAAFAVLSGTGLVACMLAVVVTQGNKWQYAAIGCFLLSAVCVGYRFNEKLIASLSFDVSVNDAEIELKGSYGLIVPFNTIGSIELETEFPPVSIRNNGISMGHKHAGYFKLTNGKNSFLFLADESAPFIHIERSGEMPVFISLTTSEETNKLYQLLLQKLAWVSSIH